MAVLGVLQVDQVTEGIAANQTSTSFIHHILPIYLSEDKYLPLVGWVGFTRRVGLAACDLRPCCSPRRCRRVYNYGLLFMADHLGTGLYRSYLCFYFDFRLWEVLFRYCYLI